MIKTDSAWSRRDVLAGLAGLAGSGLAATARGQPAAGPPIKIGQTLSLTGPLAQTGLVHKIVSEIFVDQLNKSGGLLHRPVQYILLDDQSKPDVARTLYERLLTADKVDLILGPYGTAAILAAMGVAARFHKVFIQNTMGVPHLATYAWHFSALVSGPEPEKSEPAIMFDGYASTGHPPQSIFIAVTKFPSALFQSLGTRDVATGRGVKVLEYLEYDFGTRDFGAIAARVKDADPDLLWVGALGVDGNLMLEALTKLEYKPKRHYYLYPSSGPLALLPAAQYAVSTTNFEDAEPYISTPVGGTFARLFDARARALGLPYPHADSQAANEYAGWQILVAAVEATQSLEDAKLAAWLDNHSVDTIVGRRDFKGKWHTSRTDLGQLRQIQDRQWVTVWPRDKATPGRKLMAP
jgi:branched-chain amino acid transport system substrate-binding protein